MEDDLQSLGMNELRLGSGTRLARGCVRYPKSTHLVLLFRSRGSSGGLIWYFGVLFERKVS